MLPIPFLSNYIEKIVTKQPLADSIDTLNYYITSLLLALAAFGVSCKQYFGTPIQCWTPTEFKAGWEKYAEDYCFISNSYHVPMSEEISDHHRGDHISYYRWVPIVLAIQALFFFMPNYIWSLLYKNCESGKVKALIGEEREKELNNLAVMFMEGVSVFHRYGYKFSRVSPRSGWNCALLYLFIKFLYVVNVVAQLILLNSFLGGTWFSWGAQTLSDIFNGQELPESDVFPRVILCDFTVRSLAQQHTYTIQCVIMMNMINEKMYLFIYVWFLFLSAATIANFFYYLVNLSVPSLRARLALFNIEDKRNGISRNDRYRFVHECLHPDGVLLINFVREHVGSRVASELINKLLRAYAQESISDSTNNSNSMDEKKPFMDAMALTHFDRYDPPPKVHHGHGKMNSMDHTMESAPPMDDYDRYTTMRVDDRSLLPRPTPRSSRPNVGIDHPDNGTGRTSTPTDV